MQTASESRCARMSAQEQRRRVTVKEGGEDCMHRPPSFLADSDDTHATWGFLFLPLFEQQ